MPRVSVVVPAYNAAAFIDACVGSALNQTVRDIEVIVVNDGSTDDTAARLGQWRDPRLQVISQPNAGLPGALNAGIGAARADYLGFLDADDVWRPEKLARHLDLLQKEAGVDATFSWVSVIDENGKITRMPCPRWTGAVSFAQLLTDYTIRTMSAVVMRRAAAVEAGLFDSSLVRCVDYDFFLRVARLRPGNIRAVPEVLSYYRRHETQRTRDWRRMQEGWNQLLRVTRRHSPAETAAVEKQASANMLRYFAAVAYQSGDFHDAVRLVHESFQLSPAGFLRDGRNWSMSAVALAGIILPRPAREACEKIAGFERQPR